jgi:hypothetical protein
MDKTFAEDIPAQLKYLEKLLGDKTTFASKITAGDLAIATGFNVLLALEVRRSASITLPRCASLHSYSSPNLPDGDLPLAPTAVGSGCFPHAQEVLRAR